MHIYYRKPWTKTRLSIYVAQLHGQHQRCYVERKLKLIQTFGELDGYIYIYAL